MGFSFNTEDVSLLQLPFINKVKIEKEMQFRIIVNYLRNVCKIASIYYNGIMKEETAFSYQYTIYFLFVLEYLLNVLIKLSQMQIKNIKTKFFH